MFKFGAKRRQIRQSVDLLSKGSLLSGLDRATITELVKRAASLDVQAGETLMRQGEPGNSAFLVLEGELAVIVETPLGEVTMTSLGAGQFVGEIAIFSRMPRTATVRATQPTMLLRLSDKDISDVIIRRPKAALALLAALGQRVAALNQPLAMLTLAAQALERGDVDTAEMASLFDGMEASGPFAQSFKKLVTEMEAKESQRHEMLVAARLQQSILPRRLDFASRGAGFAVEALMRPSRDIGGDFYDFFFTEDGKRAVLVVADVSGKGIPAALFMAISRTMIRTAVMTAPSIEVALARANAQIEAENPECLFVTLFMAELELATGKLRYINAGHCDGYLVRKSGEIVELPTTAPAVAMLPSPLFQCQSVEMSSGDRLMLVSDGITEAFDARGELFGEARLVGMLKALPGLTAAETVAAVDAAVCRFATGCEQSDDITCLAVACL